MIADMRDIAASPASANGGTIPKRLKIIVAVHGIGDQMRNGTILGVVAQFSRNYGREIRVPLGRFDAGTVPLKFGADADVQQPFAFAEIHWADIPRIAVRRGYLLEETKEWASRTVERLEATTTPGERGVNYQLAGRVVQEMVETIGLLETMTFLARKAGLFDFSLSGILSDYINDVQVVAEFERMRGRIVGRFNSQMESLYKAHPEAEIYIVAHSEGTVVSFLALLKAMWEKQPPRWLNQVRGYMTIGSPIDKHIVMWSDLFAYGEPCAHVPAGKIKWRNYYDYGDPVGFKLDTTRDWVKQNGVTAFDFTEEDDHGFSRYYLPGKAHNDYWDDPAVFDHFIDTVVKEPPVQTKPPRNKPFVWPVTYLVSYGIPLLLLFAGVYAVERAVLDFNQMSVMPMRFAGDVAGIAFLMAGLTLLARIPRLVNPRQCGSRKWIGIAGVLFCVFSVLYWLCASVQTREALAALPGFLIQQAGLGEVDEVLLTVATIAFVCLLSVVVAIWSRLQPRTGMKPLLLWGGGTATVMIFILLDHKEEDPPSIWPVAVALTGFLSLWWLAALLFDLIFVWHRYIRHEAGANHLKHIHK